MQLKEKCKLLRWIDILLIFCLFQIRGNGQVSDLEHIEAGEQTLYFNDAFELDSGKILLGGAEDNCKKAKAWVLNAFGEFEDSEYFVHQNFEFSEVRDIEGFDSLYLLLTYQQQGDDFWGALGLKGYWINEQFERIDSFYIPTIFESFNSKIVDTTIVFTVVDSIFRYDFQGRLIGKREVPENVEFSGYQNGLLIFDQKKLMLTNWDFTSSDSMDFHTVIKDVAVRTEVTANDVEEIFILTQDSLYKYIPDSFRSSSPVNLTTKKIVWHPDLEQLMSISNGNTVRYYNRDLERIDSVQLFYDSVYVESLNYRPLNHGKAIRFGTTRIDFSAFTDIRYSSSDRFGIYQVFDKYINQHPEKRPEISLDSIALSDGFRIGNPIIFENGDTSHWRVADNHGTYDIYFTNSGETQIHTVSLGSDALWGFNCLSHFAFGLDTSWYYSGESGSAPLGVETISEVGSFSTRKMIYVAFPNNHYDRDPKDNFMEVKIEFLKTNTQDQFRRSDVEIYPNPASGEVFLKWPVESKIENLEILNMNGQLIKEYPVGKSDSFMVLYPTSLSSGLYLLRLSGQNGYYIKKLMIQH